MSATLSAPTPTRVVRTLDDVPALGTLLGVWAHPDDEVYLSGGLLAAAAAAGRRVVVVTATRGEHGTDDPERLPPAVLARIREREVLRSLGALHPAVEHRFLGQAGGVCHLDGSLRPTPPVGAVEELAAIVDEVRPDTVLTFGPDGLTGHGDHRAVSAWTDRALRLASAAPRVLHAVVTGPWVEAFGEFVTSMDDSDDAIRPCPAELLAVDLDLTGAALDRKVAALRAQESQTAGVEAAVGGDRYRAAVAGEYFRAAGAG
ncbi:PIG-L deacetylase family protein [Pseudonocardia broussonetiae]|uniref:PIG-L deacetylase family protein n=1 Tax=Pseudonocardia broussonetiae TaxID=2736640 RepID=UPI0019644C1C|nr:PIG-L family deacetylase [Pseudonocardia broussonetiae]